MASQGTVASATGVDLNDLDQRVQSFLSTFLSSLAVNQSRLQLDNEQEISLSELRKRLVFSAREFSKAREAFEAINIELAAELAALKNNKLATEAYYKGKVEELERVLQQLKELPSHPEVTHDHMGPCREELRESRGTDGTITSQERAPEVGTAAVMNISQDHEEAGTADGSTQISQTASKTQENLIHPPVPSLDDIDEDWDFHYEEDDD
ncbi:hypothetical protein F5Y03DRAFT_46355 [Xylaria venustula]|nr:hypothetical protein F5Y03DRAFT_46355 [Xylaria venustula]